MQELSDYAQRLHDDYLFFLDELWLDRSLDRVAPLSEIERDISLFGAGISGSFDTGSIPKFRGVLAPRGVGKTHLVTACNLLWRWLRDPQRKNIVVSKSQGEAIKTVRLIREWIDSVWFLQHLKPRAGQIDNALAFDVGPATPNRQPSLTAMGIGGQLPGNRAHSIYADDVETGTNSETQTQRDKLREIVTEFKNILYGMLPGEKQEDSLIDPVEIVFVGTYHNEDSLYLFLPSRGYVFRTWCLSGPQPGEVFQNLAPIIQEGMRTGKYIPGCPIFPHRFDETNMAEKRLEGRRTWLLQHQLVSEIGENDRYPLRLSDAIVMGCHRDQAPILITWGQFGVSGSTKLPMECYGLASDAIYGPASIDRISTPYIGTKAFIDPSGKGADSTALSITSMLNGMIFVKALKRWQGGYEPETLRQIVLACREHDAREIVVEDNFGSGMLAQLIEPVILEHIIKPGHDQMRPQGWTAVVSLQRAMTRKEDRICNTLEPVFNSHRIVFDPAAIEPREHQLQITRIARVAKALKHDDVVDALAGSVALWTLDVGVDTKDAAKASIEQQILAAIEEMNGNANHEANWIN